jgi:hypothetical protein
MAEGGVKVHECVIAYSIEDLRKLAQKHIGPTCSQRLPQRIHSLPSGRSRVTYGPIPRYITADRLYSFGATKLQRLVPSMDDDDGII